MPITLRTHDRSTKEIMSYTPPKLHTGKEWYVGFNAFDPAKNEMRRKKIKLNFIDKIGERRKYADGLIKRLNVKLENGWNPWIESENGKAYHTFAEVCEHYERYSQKLHADGIHRKDTYVSNMSYIRNIKEFNDQRKNKIVYIYQFDETFIDDLLEYVYVGRDNSAQTRNNYLGFARTFSSFLVQHRYLKVRPTEGMPMISKKHIHKQRTVIADKDIVKLKDYLQEKNKNYLLAAYLLHYCFIRPTEMSQLKIENISLINQTLYIDESISKNRTSGVITLPAKVIHLMIELNLFKSPGHYYLFSDKFKPGVVLKSEKQFRDFWQNHVRKDLKFSKAYKFYSLKDTGITNMLRLMDKISVRDQARHASILTTDIYTPHDLQEANDLIKNHDGKF
jgi:integrase